MPVILVYSLLLLNYMESNKVRQTISWPFDLKKSKNVARTLFDSIVFLRKCEYNKNTYTEKANFTHLMQVLKKGETQIKRIFK